MKRFAYYLRGSSSGWALIPLDVHSEPEEVPVPEAEGLDTRGVIRHIAEQAAGQASYCAQVVIGLPAAWCLCAGVSTSGLPRSAAAQLERALSFRLESALPITAEECAVDYSGTGPDRLGIAISAIRVKGLIHALEDEGHEVVSITPRAWLAIQTWEQGAACDAVEQPATYIWSESDCGAGEATQLLHLDPDQAPRWRSIPLTGSQETQCSDVLSQLSSDGVLGLPCDRRWSVSDSNTQLPASIDPGIEISELSNPHAAECQSVQAILSRSETPWINLCRGPLAPRYPWRRVRVPALSAVAAAMLLLLTIAAVSLLRAEQHNQIANRFDAQSAEVFKQVLPGQPVPTSPQRRLNTRLKQLRGEVGMAGGQELARAHAPLLRVLHDLLTTLPTDQRFAVTDLRIEEDGLRMNGYARSHGEADQLADRIRSKGVFIVEPPSTDKLPEGGVRFSLQARHIRSELEDEPRQDMNPSTPSAPPSLAERTEAGGAR